MRVTRTVLLGMLSLAGAAPAAAQMAAGAPAKPVRLEVTTSSAEARAAFAAGMEDIFGLFVPRGVASLKKAIDLDPAFGLARVVHGINAAGLTTAQRNAEIEKGMADATKGTTGELLVATAFRENFRGNPTGARAILLTATTLVPDEPFIAHYRATLLGALPGGNAVDGIAALKTVTERFPDYFPSYNLLAYLQWNSGQRGLALTTVSTLVKKAPGHPNAHDSYAELLQWNGDFEAAIPHYKKAIELDPSFLAGANGLSEVYVLQGKGELARAALTASLPNTTTNAQRASVQARIGNSYLFEGNIKAAMAAQLAAIAEAQKGDTNYGAIAGAHLALLNLEAAFGDPKTNAKAIAAHIGHIAALPPPPNPNLTQRLFNYGVAYALAGQPTPARVYLDSLTRVAPLVTNPALATTAANQVHGLKGWVLYSEGKYAEALAELRQDGPQVAIIRTGIALTQLKLGNVAEARSIRDEMVNDRNLNLANGANVMARRVLKNRVI